MIANIAIMKISRYDIIMNSKLITRILIITLPISFLIDRALIFDLMILIRSI